MDKLTRAETMGHEKLEIDVDLAWQVVVHWLHVYETYAMEESVSKMVGPTGCRFCHEYHPFLKHRQKNCSGCPIKERTGRNYCEGTPYKDINFITRGAPEVLALIEDEYRFVTDIAIELTERLAQETTE